MIELDSVHCCDALTFTTSLPDESLDCVVTSPPYFGLRDYGVSGQIGLEETPQAFITRIVQLFSQIRRALKKTGVVWVNLGDSYGHGTTAGRQRGQRGLGEKTEDAQQITRNGIEAKQMLMIPARFAIAMQDDGWILRSECVWVKPNPMPESVTDRPTKSHEMVYMFTRSPRYWYDADAIREPHVRLWDDTNGGNLSGNGIHKANGKMRERGGDYPMPNPLGRNRRDVFTIATEPTPFAHFATFPQALIEPLILAGCPKGGVVFDPFMGSGTTALVARRLGRHYIGCDINPEYVALANTRLMHNTKEELAAALAGKPVTVPMFE